MGQFILRRTLYAVATLFILSLTIFTVVRLTGDPVALMAAPGAQEADLALVRADWGLDRPLPLQYAAFLWNIITGELVFAFTNLLLTVSNAMGVYIYLRNQQSEKGKTVMPRSNKDICDES